MNRIVVLNFGHPLTEWQKEQLAALVDGEIVGVFEVKTQIDFGKPILEEARRIIGQVPTADIYDLDANAILVGLPGLAPIAYLVMDEVIRWAKWHRKGFYVLAPEAGTTPPKFNVKEVVWTDWA